MRRTYAAVTVVIVVLVGVARANPCSKVSSVTPTSSAAFSVAPTDTKFFRERRGAGEILASRAKQPHQGVDLIATGSTEDPEKYRVFASGGGVVAYAANTDPKGYGYAVIIDHENGEYTLYAHLAIKTSERCVVVGDRVAAGEVIGFVFDPKTGEKSSGNALHVEKAEQLQVHVELIHAPKGLSSKTSTLDIKSKGTIDDPTPALTKLGYE